MDAKRKKDGAELLLGLPAEVAREWPPKHLNGWPQPVRAIMEFEWLASAAPVQLISVLRAPHPSHPSADVLAHNFVFALRHFRERALAQVEPFSRDIVERRMTRVVDRVEQLLADFQSVPADRVFSKSGRALAFGPWVSSLKQFQSATQDLSWSAHQMLTPPEPPASPAALPGRVRLDPWKDRRIPVEKRIKHLIVHLSDQGQTLRPTSAEVAAEIGADARTVRNTTVWKLWGRQARTGVHAEMKPPGRRRQGEWVDGQRIRERGGED